MTYQEAVLKQKEKKTSMQQHTNLPGQLPTSNSKPPTTTKRGGGEDILEKIRVDHFLISNSPA